MTRADDALVARAHELGVHTTYLDVHEERHDADPEALAVVVEALAADAAVDTRAVFPPVVISAPGAPPTPIGHVMGTATHRVVDAELVLSDGSRTALRPLADRHTIAVDAVLPVGCHELRLETADGSVTCTVVCPPRSMLRRGHWHGGSGLFVPTYALWDDGDPLPSFGLLARLANRLGDLGIEALTTLPLYATFLDEPFEPGPYSPASRLHWNEVFVDDDALPHADVPPLGRHLDWAAVGARRRDQLRRAAAELVGGADPVLAADLERFVAERPDVAAFARFLVERRSAAPDVDPDVERRSHELAQLLAHRQLAALAAAEREHGAAGLAIDLPIGCHPDGYERWARPDLFAEGFAIGAPPDLFFGEGQNWGLPPQLPGAGRRSGHRLWRDLLGRAGEHAALVRIDHVMAVHRLWWVPDGFGADRGVYVAYPQEELLATIAATAAETGTVVVGEDLGTVPDEVRELLAAWEMLGMHEEQFHMTSPMLPDRGLAPIDARTVAGIRTHDMQPFAAFVAEHGDELAEYRRRLAVELGHPVADTYGEILDAVLARLVRSASSLVTVDLDDLVGETEHHNVPGAVLPSNWRRRLDRPLSAVLDDAGVRDRLTTLGGRRRG